LEFPDTEINSINYGPTEEPTIATHVLVPDEKPNHSEQHDLQKLPNTIGLPILVKEHGFDPVKNLSRR
jgi:hypothetical protein